MTADAGSAAPDDQPVASVPVAPDPTTWKPAGRMGGARLSHTATLLKDGRVFVAGGEDDSQYQIDTTAIYDPATNAWTEGPKLPAARSNHCAALLPDGRVLIFGGGQSTPTGQPLGGETVTNTVLTFDPATGKIEDAPPMKDKRSHFQSVTLADGRIVAVGGGGPDQGSPKDCGNAPYCGPFAIALAGSEAFDPNTRVWTKLGDFVETRNTFALTKLADGRVMVTGGWTIEDGGRTSTEILDPQTGTWSTSQPLLGKREHHVATLLGSGRVFVAAGKIPNVTPLNSTELFDPAAPKWQRGPLTGEPRTMPGLVTLQSGHALIVGGYAQLAQLSGKPSHLQDAYIYDDDAHELRKLPSTLKTGRVMHTTTVLKDGRVLVAGGEGEAGMLASAEIAEP